MVRRAMRSRLGRVTATVAAVVLLASCGASSAKGSGAGAASSATAASTAGSSATGSSAAVSVDPSSAPAILQFSAPLVAGGALDGTTFTGKPVAFWFWAPW